MRFASRPKGWREEWGRRIRVLIADDDRPFARRLSQYLGDQGYECCVVTSISEAQNTLRVWAPDTVFVDLMLPETNALALCKFIRQQGSLRPPKIVVMSKQTLPQGIETMRRAGASHYLVKPFSLEDALRVIAGANGTAEPTPGIGPGSSTMRELHLLTLFLKQAMSGASDTSEVFYNLMRMVSLKVHAVRCSVIQCLNADTGLVLACNDDHNVQGLPISLADYPEVCEVQRTRSPVMIYNTRTSELLAPVRAKLEGLPFETMALFPVFCRGQFFGVMSLRMEHKDKTELYYVEKFGQVCAQIISLAIATNAP